MAEGSQAALATKVHVASGHQEESRDEKPAEHEEQLNPRDRENAQPGLLHVVMQVVMQHDAGDSERPEGVELRRVAEVAGRKTVRAPDENVGGRGHEESAVGHAWTVGSRMGEG